MKMKIGIDAIDYYVPPIALRIDELAKARDISPAKLEKGLGLHAMSLTDVNEDAASLAANALLRLIENNKIDPTTIGRIYLGTESAIDAAKPTSTYAVGAVEDKLTDQFGERCFKNCDVVDLTFACIGAIDALENCIDWVRANPSRKAIVLASDIAKYKLNSSGEYTQGAGAIATLISSNPNILEINDTIGIGMQHVGDFFKPRRTLSNIDLQKFSNGITVQEITESSKEKMELFSEEPVFDGHYSNECYQNRIKEALDHFNEQKKTDFLEDWNHLIFHLPYAYQGRRMMLDIWLLWIKEKGLIKLLEEEVGPINSMVFKDWKKEVSKSTIYQKFIKEKIADGEKASMQIGNMYTGSIFMSLISLLVVSMEQQKELAGTNIGFLSYGSGSKSKILEGTISKYWLNKVKDLSIFETLKNRIFIDFSTYNKLHNCAIDKPISKKKAFVLSGIDDQENKKGFRHYKY
jgi:hydroxymethylglutaryl-CoA synthase